MSTTPIPIYGEAEAGEGAKLMKEVKAIVKGISINTFDLFEKLHAIKKNKFFAPKYQTFGEYAKSLNIKLSKAYYGVKIVEIAEACGITRAVYEPLGIAKLRIISRVELEQPDGSPKMYDLGTGLPVTGVEVVQALMKHAESQDPKELEQFVRKVNGQVGEYAPTWVNISMTEGQRAKWQEAVNLAKANIGSVSKDAEGNYVDASEGKCAEVIAVSYLLDPNNYPEGEGPSMQTTKDLIQKGLI